VLRELREGVRSDPILLVVFIPLVILTIIALCGLFGTIAFDLTHRCVAYSLPYEHFVGRELTNRPECIRWVDR
jgi:hypothetical protein